MIAEAINRLESLFIRTQQAFDVDGVSMYRDQSGALRRVPPSRFSEFRAPSLSGFADYINDGPDVLPPSVFVSIDTGVVSLVGKYDPETNARDSYVTTTAPPEISLPERADHERFCIWVATNVEGCEERTRLLGLMASISREDVETIDDDGTSQTVKTRRGVSAASSGSAPVANPFRLPVRRSFVEINPEPFPCLFRIHGTGSNAAFSLFEVDGYDWQTPTRASIGLYLRSKVDNAYLAFIGD